MVKHVFNNSYSLKTLLFCACMVHLFFCSAQEVNSKVNPIETRYEQTTYVNQLEKALETVNESLDIPQENEVTVHKVYGLIIKGQIYFAQKNLVNAKSVFINALKIVKGNVLIFDEYRIYGVLWKIDLFLNLPSLALNHYNKYIEMKQALHFTENLDENSDLSLVNIPQFSTDKNTGMYELIMPSILILIFLLTGITIWYKNKIIQVKEMYNANREFLEFKVSMFQKDLKEKKTEKSELLETIQLKDKEIASFEFRSSQNQHLSPQKENKLSEKENLLLKELNFKNKQLTSFKFCYEQKIKIIGEILDKIDSVKKVPAIEKDEMILKLEKLVKDSLNSDKNWGYFRQFFEESQAGYYSKLKSKHKDLKNNDLKLCSLIRLNLSVKETAEILAISPGSLKTARYRLRKKLNLKKGENIVDYLINLSSELDDIKI